MQSCGAGFEDGGVLDSHTAEAHHPKRTVTINDIVSIVLDGTLNLPKTKAEIVKEAERNKNNKPEVAPEISQPGIPALSQSQDELS